MKQKSPERSAVRYIERRARGILSDYVSGYWFFQKKPEEIRFEEDYAWPEVGGSLYVVLGDPVIGPRGPFPPVVLIGGSRSALPIRFLKSTLICGARFRCGGMKALFGILPSKLVGAQGLENRWSRELAERLFDPAHRNDPQTVLSFFAEALAQRIGQIRDNRGIERRFARSLCGASVSDLAQSCPCSLRTLQRIWPNESGYCLREHKAVLRCEWARYVLYRRETVNLSELGLDLGFYDLAHFCRTFKRWTGFTPEGYRRWTAPYRGAFPEWLSSLSSNHLIE